MFVPSSDVVSAGATHLPPLHAQPVDPHGHAISTASAVHARPLPPECSAVTYAIHKPRGVISAARDANPHRRTLIDVMLAAGVQPLPGHIGRLDLETSGLILVTADGLLLEAMLGRRTGIKAAADCPLTKTYELLLAGQHAPGSSALRKLGEPLTHQRDGRKFHSDAAAGVRWLRSFQCARTPTRRPPYRWP